MPESQDLYLPSDLEKFQSLSLLLDVYCIFVFHPFIFLITLLLFCYLSIPLYWFLGGALMLAAKNGL